jgi:CPA2 family monovalent cation:H+ antiporter-2
VLVLFGLGVLSKEHIVVLPAWLLLTDFWWNPGFSLKGIRANWRLYVPVALGAAGGVAMLWGWSFGAGLVLGLSLSVASTVVLLKALEERNAVTSTNGRIAIGWLIVEDLAMVLALVLLPPLAGILKGQAGADFATLGLPLLLTLGKVVAFVAIMLVVGRRAIPWLLHYVAHTGSRELFRLAVLAIALGVAFGSTKLFDVSLALGAFFAGMMLRESPLSQRAAQESLPLRDAFAVLFFVSVGMLFNPAILLADWAPLIATVLIIVIGKSLAAYAIVRAFRHSHATALTISVSLAQIGEFSFILASLGVALTLLPERGRDLVLAGAIVSILLNPLLFAMLDRTLGAAEPAKPDGGKPADGPREPLPVTTLTGHVVLVGHGRVGSFISDALGQSDRPALVIDSDPGHAERARGRGFETIAANAADPEVLQAANLGAARCLLVAIPDAFEGGQVVEQGRKINPALTIIARAHSDDEVAHLEKHGATAVVMGEHEIAKAMLASIPPAAPSEPAAEAAT